MTNTTKQQKAKVGVSGSFMNQLMSNNSSLPEVGKGATQMHYSDRTCYEVIEVSKDGKTVKLEELDAKVDPTKQNGMGHQNWILEPTGHFKTVVWRQNAWRVIGKEIVFTKEFIEKANNLGFVAPARALTPEQDEEIYGKCGSFFTGYPLRVVEGITKERKTYTKVNLLFGRKDYYYDWTF